MGRLRIYLRREWLNLILVLAAIALGLNCVWAPRGMRDLLILRQHRQTLEARCEGLRAERDSLKTIVQKLRSDEAFIARRIRSELGFVRPGELVYRFASDPAQSSSR